MSNKHLKPLPQHTQSKPVPNLISQLKGQGPKKTQQSLQFNCKVKPALTI
jgi:hypothetical protein